MSDTPRTDAIAPVGYARAQDLLLYSEVWAGYSNKPADENGHPPVALYTQDQVNAMLTAERERAAIAEARAYSRGLQLGWNLGVSNDNDGFNRALSDARAEVQDAIDAARRK